MKKNYKHYIYARGSSNFGDSIFLQMTIFYIAGTSNSELNMTINYLIISICGLILLFFGPYVDRVFNKKKLLIGLEILLLIFSIMICLSIYNNDLFIFFFMILLFTLFNKIREISEFSLKKSIVLSEDLISFNKIYNLTGKTLDQVANITSFYIIMYGGYLFTTLINIATYIVSIFNLKKLKVTSTPYNSEVINDLGILKEIVSGYTHFKSGKLFVLITFNDALLLSGTALINIYLPIYLEGENLLYLYPAYLFSKTLGWYVSTLYSEKIIAKFNNVLNIFKIDYILNFMSIIIFLVTKNIYLYFILTMISSIPQGLTGILYEPIAYSEYQQHFMGRIGSFISFIFSFSSFLIILFNMVALYFEFQINIFDVLVYCFVINIIVLLLSMKLFHNKKIAI